MGIYMNMTEAQSHHGRSIYGERELQKILLCYHHPDFLYMASAELILFPFFLLTKGGELMERKLHRRKWKWKVHGRSEAHILSSITPIMQDELNDKTSSLFLTTASGSVLEYRVPKYSASMKTGSAQDNQILENWVSHFHPPNAKVARGVSGLQFQVGRMIFQLDDGRLGELHLSGLGGETVGPTHPISFRRKASLKYVWSVLDAPESEGWNAEYCTEERGPTNCMVGIKDEPSDTDIERSRGRKGNKAQQSYLLPCGSGSNPAVPSEEYNMPDNWINTNFRLRVVHGGRSFFLITDIGLTFEYLNAENVWLWLRHEHPTAMRGAVGHYNGSLFLVDEHGSLLIRERNNSELSWINCTGMRKGRHIIGGPPWDRFPGQSLKVTAEDAMFFVSRTGRLMQFTVGENIGSEEVCTDEDFAAEFEKNEENLNKFNRNCDPKVAPIRPIPFSEDSVIFELKDGRLAEMQLVEKTRWVWSRTIATPTSLCIAHFWTGLVS
ncbi:hypothetical protein Acr_28g0014110 [Actinidia rufa]|uniref:Uncharacterized protein n=1 Tax=Actinidia rufa TaxID=165716 RepID=A0A7J0HC85_9ERIC|nr:hypothetical protein Acr_28g0014110 [Actinidia rufa]